MGGQPQFPSYWLHRNKIGKKVSAQVHLYLPSSGMLTLHLFCKLCLSCMKASNVASCFQTGEPTICKGLNKLTRVSNLMLRLESESILKSFSKARLLITQYAIFHLSLFPLIKLPVSCTLAYLPISSLWAYPCSELSENSEVILNCSEKSPFREAYIVPGELPVSFL